MGLPMGALAGFAFYVFGADANRIPLSSPYFWFFYVPLWLFVVGMPTGYLTARGLWNRDPRNRD
jgi:hypothetical protein